MNFPFTLENCRDERHAQFDKEWPKKIVELRKECSELKTLKTGIEHDMLEVYQSAKEEHERDGKELMNAKKIISELRLKLEAAESTNTDLRAKLENTTSQLNNSIQNAQKLSDENATLLQKIEIETERTNEIVDGAVKVGEVFKLKLESFDRKMERAKEKVEASYLLVAKLENENMGLRWLLENSEKLKIEANPPSDYIATALKTIGVSLHHKPKSRDRFEAEIADIVKTRKRKCTMTEPRNLETKAQRDEEYKKRSE